MNSKNLKKRLKPPKIIFGTYKIFASLPDKRSHNATISSEVQNFLPIKANVFVPGSKSDKFLITATAASCVSKYAIGLDLPNNQTVLFRITHTGHWRSIGGFRGFPELGNDDLSGNR